MTPDEALRALHAAEQALAAAGVRPFPVPLGGRAPVVAGTLSALAAGDAWAPGLRERAGAIVRGVRPEVAAAPERDALSYGVLAPDGSPGLRALRAVGMAVARPDRVTAVHLGVGSLADGAVHEALNLAALLAVPVLFVVAFAPIEPDAPVPGQLAPALVASPRAWFEAYGLEVREADGDDAASVARAVAAARERGGPAVILAHLTRP